MPISSPSKALTRYKKVQRSEVSFVTSTHAVVLLEQELIALVLPTHSQDFALEIVHADCCLVVELLHLLLHVLLQQLLLRETLAFFCLLLQTLELALPCHIGFTSCPCLCLSLSDELRLLFFILLQHACLLVC
jgi:hypothetical protein